VTGHARKVPDRVRARRERRKAERYAEPEMLPDRPDLRDNFAGRMRASLDWFSRLPPLSRRSILVKGLVAAVVAFLIGMAAVWGVERVINNSLSCGLWANCPDGAEPGIRLVDDGSGAGPTFSGGRAGTRAVPVNKVQDPAGRLNGVQQDGSFQQGSPDFGQPAPRGRDARPGGIIEPGWPAEQERPAQQARPLEQETPSSSSASPAPARPAPGEMPEEPELMPQDASPAPAQ
jgi:hypothetical protein